MEARSDGDSAGLTDNGDLRCATFPEASQPEKCISRMSASFALQAANSLLPVTTSASGPPQLQEAQEHSVTARDLNFVMDMCARVEAESTVCRRMALRNLKNRRNRAGNLSRPFDIEADLENSLYLVECLPQGSRGADPPHEEFLQLARSVLGTEASAEQILESALLFEEQALRLLSENDSQFESQHSRPTISPWLILLDLKRRIPAQSQVALSWPDKWLARRISRLLGGGAPNLQAREQFRSGRRELGENRHCRRTRKRKRKEMERAGSDRVTEWKKDGTCDACSSDNYSDTGDEHEEKSQVDSTFGED